MPKRPFIPNATAPYHVTARAANQAWFPLPMPVVWEIFSDYLYLIRLTYNVEIISFVLMNNHYHMLIRTPDANLPQAMNYLQRETSRQINFHAKRINQVWGGRYSASLVLTNKQYANVYKYVYRNPVDAGITTHAEIYRYSTLNGLFGLSRLSIPLIHDRLLFEDPTTRLQWLNSPFPNQNMRGQIRRALRQRQFEFGKERDRRLLRG